MVYSYYLARQYYEIREFTMAENVLLDLEQNPNYKTSNNYNYFIAFRTILNISTLNFEKANATVQELFTNQADLVGFYHMVILRYFSI